MHMALNNKYTCHIMCGLQGYWDIKKKRNLTAAALSAKFRAAIIKHASASCILHLERSESFKAEPWNIHVDWNVKAVTFDKVSCQKCKMIKHEL